MSSYNKKTKHPKTGEWEDALWLDDCFGHHNYGVVFPSDEVGRDAGEPLSAIAFDVRDYELEVNSEGEKTGELFGQAQENISAGDYLSIDGKTGLVRKALSTDVGSKEFNGLF